MGKRKDIAVDKRRKRKYRRLARYEKKARKSGCKRNGKAGEGPQKSRKKKKNGSLLRSRKASPENGL